MDLSKISILLLCTSIVFMNCFSDRRVSNHYNAEMKVLISLIENPVPFSVTPSSSTIPENRVYANLEWQDSGYELKENLKFQLSATGSWYMTASTPIPPEGTSTNPALFSIDYRLNKNFLHGQLLCRNSNSRSEIFSLGWTTPAVSGRLECQINDTHLTNNSGFLKIILNYE
ncbi:MAG: hypothetical protein H7A24_09880 [Leptospiraceae bacterium]|nr:hypothetical protein [Leptospiraceae bacterium]MCP5512178.1 hypothetical protein [Leptospiraceae bacterium]